MLYIVCSGIANGFVYINFEFVHYSADLTMDMSDVHTMVRAAIVKKAVKHGTANPASKCSIVLEITEKNPIHNLALSHFDYRSHRLYA